MEQVDNRLSEDARLGSVEFRISCHICTRIPEYVSAAELQFGLLTLSHLALDTSRTTRSPVKDAWSLNRSSGVANWNTGVCVPLACLSCSGNEEVCICA